MPDQLPSGSRIIDFAADTPVKHDTFLNAIQDELIDALEVRPWDITNLLVPEYTGNWTFNYFGAAGLDWYWIVNAASAGDRMMAVIPARDDETISKIHVIYKNSNQAGGEIALYSKQRMLVGDTEGAGTPAGNVLHTSVKVADLGAQAPNPWQLGVGVGCFHVETAVAQLMDPGYQYSVWVEASTGGTSDQFLGLFLETQFSTG